MSVSQVFLILFLIALNGFFAAVEFAVVAARRSRLDAIAGEDHRAAKLVRRWLEDGAARDRVIAAAQLGITLSSLTLGAVGQEAFEDLLQAQLGTLSVPSNLAYMTNLLPFMPLFIALTVVTSFHVVLGEQVPKATVLRSPEQFALRIAPLMQGFIRVFHFFIAVIEWSSRSVLRLFGLADNGYRQSAIVSMDELKQLVAGPEAEKTIAPPEREMLTAVINFGELIVRQVSVPRTEIIAVQSGTPVIDAVRLASQHGVTKLPVYESSLDQITGILHLKDLLPGILEDEQLQHKCARELAREALFVPESIPVNRLLMQMRARRQHMAITMDEFGGTAGLVTLEDLLEEIVGDVSDSIGDNPPSFQLIPDGSAIVDGMAMIEEVNQFFNLQLDDPNYDTIAGYVLGRLGRIAQTGDLVEDMQHGVRLRVDSMDRLRIARIHLSRL